MLSKASKLILIMAVCLCASYGLGYVLGSLDKPDASATTAVASPEPSASRPVVEAMASDRKPKSTAEKTESSDRAAEVKPTETSTTPQPKAETKKPSEPSKRAPDVVSSTVREAERHARKPKAHVAGGYNEGTRKQLPADQVFTPIKPEDRW